MIRRPATESETHWVVHSWLGAMRPQPKGNPPDDGWMFVVGRGVIDHRLWCQLVKAHVTRIIAMPQTQVEVVDVDGEPMGWTVWETDPTRPRIHFVFVTGPGRRMGLGRFLLEPLIVGRNVELTHMTRPGAYLAEACGLESQWGRLGPLGKR